MSIMSYLKETTIGRFIERAIKLIFYKATASDIPDVPSSDAQESRRDSTLHYSLLGSINGDNEKPFSSDHNKLAASTLRDNRNRQTDWPSARKESPLRGSSVFSTRGKTQNPAEKVKKVASAPVITPAKKPYVSGHGGG